MKPLAYSLILLLLAGPVLAAEPVTIGYVDMEKVLTKSDRGLEAKAALEKKFSGPQKALGEDEQAIVQLQQSLARDQALMSQAELDRRKTEIQKRVLELRQKAAEAQQALNEEQATIGGEIIEVAQKVIEELAKEKELSAIFERTRGGLLYIDDNLDLTAEVIKRLNAKGKKKK